MIWGVLMEALTVLTPHQNCLTLSMICAPRSTTLNVRVSRSTQFAVSRNYAAVIGRSGKVSTSLCPSFDPVQTTNVATYAVSKFSKQWIRKAAAPSQKPLASVPTLRYTQEKVNGTASQTKYANNKGQLKQTKYANNKEQMTR